MPDKVGDPDEVGRRFQPGKLCRTRQAPVRQPPPGLCKAEESNSSIATSGAAGAARPLEHLYTILIRGAEAVKNRGRRSADKLRSASIMRNTKMSRLVLAALIATTVATAADDASDAQKEPPPRTFGGLIGGRWLFEWSIGGIRGTVTAMDMACTILFSTAPIFIRLLQWISAAARYGAVETWNGGQGCIRLSGWRLRGSGA